MERDDLLSELREHARASRTGDGRIVLVGGEAGAGKTSLAVRAARRLTRPVHDLIEGTRALVMRRRKIKTVGKLHTHTWLHGLPLKTRFRHSRLYISALLPFTIGFAVGIISAIMGVGGAFVLVPLMIYLLGMPTAIVVGTSLFQIIFVSINVTFLQAIQNQTVDIVLALLLRASQEERA